MSRFERTDSSVLGRWWWTVDRFLLAAMISLMVTGFLLLITASPAVAERINLDALYFVKRQVFFIVLGLAVAFALSMMSIPTLIRMACVLFVVTLIMMVLVLLVGSEVKGAARWLNLGVLTIQPSELMKPALIVVTAWLIDLPQRQPQFYGKRWALILMAMVGGLLVLQPDLGMTIVLSTVWFGQMILGGLALYWAVAFVLTGCVSFTAAYLLLPHVQSRIDRFLDPSSGDSYQVARALEALISGGLVGVGPGEGVIKNSIPDAHTDFIFAVAGEEFGLLMAMLIIAAYAVVVIRGILKLRDENNMFVLLAAGGLYSLIGLQALVNIGSAVQLIPTKGMTLPLMSYGGSSMMGVCIVFGMLLALTRRRHEAWS